MADYRETVKKIERALGWNLRAWNNLGFSTIRVAFIKYAIDNYVGAWNMETMQCYADAQKMFAIKDTVRGMETISSILEIVDEYYRLDGILSAPANIEKYMTELFGTGQKGIRKNADEEDFKKVLDVIGDLDFKEEKESHEIGKALVNALKENIVAGSGRSMYRNEATTKESLSLLAKKILEVKRTDTFCDFASGVGFSTITITGDACPEIVCNDINPETAALSAMLFIMYGYDRMKISCCNSLSQSVYGCHGNRVFVDPPLGTREKSYGGETVDGPTAAVSSILCGALEAGGLAVVVTPSGSLFREKGMAVSIREELVFHGFLKAVIALPPMYGSTTVGTNMLVISREPSFKVLFINAAQPKDIKYKSDMVGGAILPEELIDRIVDLIKYPRNEEGFAYIATEGEITKKDLNLVPAAYVVVKDEDDLPTMAELDNRLREQYRKLMDYYNIF